VRLAAVIVAQRAEHGIPHAVACRAVPKLISIVGATLTQSRSDGVGVRREDDSQIRPISSSVQRSEEVEVHAVMSL
jgi:hypothetical protein